MPTQYGEFRAYGFVNKLNGEHHVALVKGDINVDESMLNGETKEQYKEAGTSKNITESNKVFRGTVVCSGEAIMLVVMIGMNTVYGKLAQELTDKQPDSPLKLKLRNLANIISRIGYIGAFLVSFSYLFSMIVIKNNFDVNLMKETVLNFPLMLNYLLYALTLSVTIIVVAVPDGLYQL